MGALRAAVSEMDGRVDVRSRSGRGTCLRLTLPTSAAQASEAA
jgi:chemotaxis protein histidine kinase CheA